MDFQFITEEGGLRKKEAVVESYGSVQGVLEASPCQGEGVFTVKEAWSGKLVQCRLEGELASQAKEAIGRRVVVSGRKLTSKDGKSKAVAGWEMQVLPRDEDLPTIEEMKGIYPDMTGGLPSEVYVKSRFYGEGCAP